MQAIRHVDFEAADWGEFPAGPVLHPGYRGRVLDAGPIAYWRFGESVGDVAADEMGGSDGAYLGGCTLGRPGAIARDDDAAVALDGDGGRIIAEGAPLNLAGPLTMLAWVRPLGENIEQTHQSVISRWNGDTGEHQYMLLLWRPGPGEFRLGAALDVGGSVLTGPGDALLALGQWRMLAITWDGAVIRRYVDGVEDGEGVAAAGTMPAHPTLETLIGRKVGGSLRQSLCGEVDEAAIFDRALAGETLRELYHSVVAWA